jgi:hypothetical protein
MATTRHETAATILNDAAVEEGLDAVADPFASSDPAMVRMCRLLSSAGRELVALYQWPHLRKVCDITAANGDGRAYTVPADFLGLVPGTAWNQTQDEEIRGPISPEAWQEYEANGETPLDPCFRLVQGVFAIAPTASVADGDLIQYEYHGKSWVSATGGTVPTDDRVTAATDIVYFQPTLVRVALRRAWRMSNGFDTGVIEAQYWRALDGAMSAETAGETLSLSRSDRSILDRIPSRSWSI